MVFYIQLIKFSFFISMFAFKIRISVFGKLISHDRFMG